MSRRRACAPGLIAGALAFACSGCPSNPTPGDGGAPTPDVGGTDARLDACIGDDECGDGSFCNGRERCDAAAAGADARGCAPSRGRPCLDVQVCEEATDTCVTDCGADRDADDDGIDAANCPGGTDCDDADALRHPGLTEVCDGSDHDEDCDDATFGERDLDRDGAFDARCCNEDATGARTCGDDCDDTRRGVRPLGTEVCNGLDDDCSGVVDDGVTVAGFADVDRDLHGDPMAATMACAGAVGVSSVDDDCDDARGDAHGAQVEICDGRDNDCDGEIDEHARPVTWYRDADGDGFGAAASGTMVSCAPLDGYSLLATDCDDTNRSRSPVAVEICDGLDDDCNGLSDFAAGVNDREDDDGDGHADAACGGDDCDDGDASAYAGAPEICDFRDSDCDGLSDQGATLPIGSMADTTAEVDWFADVDQDGWGAAGSPVRSCEPQLGRVVRADDCADTDGTRHPGAIDVCDGIDDDCDARIDEDAPDLAFYADVDGDRDGTGAPTLACRPPPSLTIWPGDCAPADATRGPGIPETCNAIDDDCDGAIDEFLFRDADGDGHGDPTMPAGATCSPGDVGLGDDCNDGTAALSPALPETCNALDDDCDGVVDEAGAELCVVGTDHGMCIAGRCEFACAPGTADCDGSAANGCETDLATDPRHCGACRSSCGVGGACGGLGGCDDPILEVSLGYHESCAVRRSGGVLCWTAPAPTVVEGVTAAVDVVVSVNASCALRSAGDVWCWGDGGSGLLGRGIEGGSFPARVVPGVAGALAIAGAWSNVCVVLGSGEVVCWGGGAAPTLMPVVPSRIGAVSTADRIWAGEGRAADSVFIGTSAGRLLAFSLRTPWVPGGYSVLSEVTLYFPSPVVALDAGFGLDSSEHGCARLGDGSAWCWGNNSFDALGEVGPGSIVPERRTASALEGAVEFAFSGGYVGCGRFPDGAVRCSGDCNGHGLRGDGCAVARAVGTTVTGLDGASPGDLDDAVSLATYSGEGNEGGFCAVRRRGDVVCWGDARFLGAGFGLTVATTPVRVITD